MHIIIALFVFLFVAALFELLKDPNKWYGSMVCLNCGYRWASRKAHPPARCPKCSGRHLHAATKNQPVPSKPPFDPLATEAPRKHHALRSRGEGSTVAARLPDDSDGQNGDQIVGYSFDKEKEKHKRLERILGFRDISIEEKAYFLVAFTKNADPTNLMHRLKISEAKAGELLEYLERVGHVSPQDDAGERLVIAQEPP